MKYELVEVEPMQWRNMLWAMESENGTINRIFRIYIEYRRSMSICMFLMTMETNLANTFLFQCSTTCIWSLKREIHAMPTYGQSATQSALKALGAFLQLEIRMIARPTVV